jgi:hypothetical protein
MKTRLLTLAAAVGLTITGINSQAGLGWRRRLKVYSLIILHQGMVGINQLQAP